MNSERVRNSESRNGIRFARAAAPVAAILLLAGCSSVPDWADPTDWFGSDEAAQTTESAEKPAAETPGADKEFPNLASVPDRPRAPSEEDRKRLADSLTADRENAQYSKEVIRRQSASTVPPPPPAPPSASSARTAATAPATAAANAQRAVTPLPTPPSPAARSAPAPSPVPSPAPAAAAPAGSTLSQAPVSRPPQFAPRPPSPAAPAAAPNAVPQFSARPNPNVRSVARIGNPSFGAPPPDIAAAMGAGSAQQAAAPRLAAPPRVAGTFSNGTSPGGGAAVATVRFRAGSASLTSNARQQVRRIAGMYRQRGGAIRVEGHASSRTRNMDPVQHHLVNFNVSLNRANAVANELVRQGVPSEAVFVAAMSDSQPLYYEVMPAGDAGNQRVEIHFVN